MDKWYMPTPLDIKASEYAELYFDDMRLAKGSIVEKFFWLSYQDGSMEYALPHEFSSLLDANNYRYIVEETPDGIAGQCCNTEHIVTISPTYEEDDKTLLHEMIHVFIGLLGCTEDFINPYGENVAVGWIPPFVRDALMLSLYTELSHKIPDLDYRILAHANVHSGERITVEGGNHDVLFFLKSLDLDLKLGCPLGTICGYGREKYDAS